MENNLLGYMLDIEKKMCFVLLICNSPCLTPSKQSHVRVLNSESSAAKSVHDCSYPTLLAHLIAQELMVSLKNKYTIR